MREFFPIQFDQSVGKFRIRVQEFFVLAKLDRNGCEKSYLLFKKKANALREKLKQGDSSLLIYKSGNL